VAGLLVTESPAGMGATMVLNGSLLNAGSAVGTALGGALLALGGYDALAFGLPIFAILAAALVWHTPGPRDATPAV
jgi:predicted MFS family arabinose efflux permease